MLHRRVAQSSSPIIIGFSAFCCGVDDYERKRRRRGIDAMKRRLRRYYWAAINVNISAPSYADI